MHLAFNFIALAAIAPMLFVTAAPVDTMALAARDPDPINVSNTFQACYTAYDSFTPKADIEKRCGKIRREAKADPNFLMCYISYESDLPHDEIVKRCGKAKREAESGQSA